MQVITDWLKGPRDYEQGRALYEQHGPDAGLKVVFSLGDSPFTRKKLVDALGALATSSQVREKSGDFLTEAPDGLKLVGPAPEVPAVLGKVIAARKQMHNERRELHAQLRMMALDHPQKYTNADRYAVQVKIDALGEEIDACWAAERYFKEHGRLPEPPKPAPVPVMVPTPENLRARLVTVRTYLTPTYRKRVKADRLAEYEAERDALERALVEKES